MVKLRVSESRVKLVSTMPSMRKVNEVNLTDRTDYGRIKIEDYVW